MIKLLSWFKLQMLLFLRSHKFRGLFAWVQYIAAGVLFRRVNGRKIAFAFPIRYFSSRRWATRTKNGVEIYESNSIDPH